ncbi:MAG: FkbM family methyltransferase [Flavobacteriales bacterium]|nr:FkbM family methyltransferase [Flavobacteriales bacterium]
MQGRALVVDRIELRTVDGFCQEQGIERIHYLKVDTEGHELSVLKGAHEMIEQGKVDFIQFEFGECHLDSRVFFRDLFTFLSPRYLVHRILPEGIWPLPAYAPDRKFSIRRTTSPSSASADGLRAVASSRHDHRHRRSGVHRQCPCGRTAPAGLAGHRCR